MKINNMENIEQNDNIVFLNYGGSISQDIISQLMEKLENEFETSDVNMGIANNIYTIFVELSQNMMNYSKNEIIGSREISPNGMIIISKDEESYFIDSQNILSMDDKIKIQPKLIDITTLDKSDIKKKYKELRRSGKDTHEKGGGIGFYEIAKRCDEVGFVFNPINEDKFDFHIKIKINIKKEK